MQEAGTIRNGEVVIGKPRLDGTTYVKKWGYPGTGRWLPSEEEACGYAVGLISAWDHALSLKKENNEDR